MNIKYIKGKSNHHIVFVTGYGDDAKMVIDYCESYNLAVTILRSEEADLSYLTLASPSHWANAVDVYKSSESMTALLKLKPEILMAHSLGTFLVYNCRHILPILKCIMTSAGVADPFTMAADDNYNFMSRDTVLESILPLGDIFSTVGELSPIGLYPSIHAFNIEVNSFVMKTLALESFNLNHSTMKLVPLAFYRRFYDKQVYNTKLHQRPK